MKGPLEIAKFLPKKDKLIGLDIGSSSIKLAQFVHQDGKLTLLELKQQEIDLQKDRPKAQLDALKKLFSNVEFQEAKVNVVIICPRSCTKILTIPYMPKSEILQALKWEMKNLVSFSIDEAMLDYEILQEIAAGGVKKLKVAVACSPRETINSYLDLLNQLGAKPTLFTQAGFALKNIISALVTEEDKAIGILDIGYNFSELFIFQNKSLSFSRKLPVAGRDFTQALTQVLTSESGKVQLTCEEAEKLKIKCGIPEAGKTDALEGKLTCTQLISLLRPNVEKLATELERSFDFYREKEQGARVQRLILLGAGSNLMGLDKNLIESLDIPVELGNPLKGLHLAEPSLLKIDHTVHNFAQAIGVALSSPHQVNLLPIEIKEQTKLLIERSTLKALVTSIIVILILGYIGMKISLGTYDKRMAAARLEFSTLGPRMEEVQKELFSAAILEECVYWSDALKEIGNRILEQILLTEMQAQEKSLILKGEIKSSDKAFEKVLTEFMSSLEKGIFKEVNLVSTRKGASLDEPYRFELRLSLE